MMEKKHFIFPLAVALWLAAAFVSCREDDAPESQGLTGITTALVNTTPTEITVCGVLLPEAGGGIREWGVCWGAKPGVTTDAAKVTVPVAGNTFQVVLPNLEPMRVYYVRCYAVNDEGTVYGNELSVVAGDMELTPKEIPDTAFRRVLLEACDHNGDGRLMVSEAAVLASLKLWNNDMASLEGGRYLYRLEWLELNADRVVELKDMPRLQHVSCSGNQTSFKVENCPMLEKLMLQLNYSQAVSLVVEGCPELKFLDLAYMGLADLDLRNMPELRQLVSISCPLTSLDLNPCLKLEALRCENNQLTVLDVSMLLGLQGLSCSGNRLTALDVSGQTELEYLDCDGNQLTELKLCSESKLQKLFCGGNQLTELDVSTQVELFNLRCDRNNLASLDVSRCSKIEHLWCGGNQLTELDVSTQVELFDLRCDGNNLASLDVSRCSKIEHLRCDGNRLTELRLCSESKLQTLSCGGNQLTELDVSTQVELFDLHCDGNNLASLDVSRCPELLSLSCGNNLLTTLDVSKCPLLEKLECKGNAPLVTILISPEQAALQDAEGDIPGWSIPAGTAYVIAGR